MIRTCEPNSGIMSAIRSRTTDVPVSRSASRPQLTATTASFGLNAGPPSAPKNGGVFPRRSAGYSSKTMQSFSKSALAVSVACTRCCPVPKRVAIKFRRFLPMCKILGPDDIAEL